MTSDSYHISDRPLRFILAASLLTLSLGTVHGFSVLIEPLEDLFELGRTATSLFYSLSLVCLTIAVLFSPRLLHQSLIHISDTTRRYDISYAVFSLKKNKDILI